METISQDTWKLQCPPKNWQEPVTIEERDLRLLNHVSARLGLVITRDDKHRKVYLGQSLVSEAETPHLVRYPSGWSADVIFDEDAGPEYRCVDFMVAAPLIAAFPDAQLSKNLRLSDFRPGRHSYDYIRVAPGLVQALEDIRIRAGLPIRVISGYRPYNYNLQMGAVSTSTHVDGIAADIYCEGLSTDQLLDICEDVIGSRGGVGSYRKSGFVHVDVRGYEALWFGA